MLRLLLLFRLFRFCFAVYRWAHIWKRFTCRTYYLVCVCLFVFFLFYSTNTIPKNVHSHALHDYLCQKSKLHCLHKRVFSCFHRHIEKQIHQALFKLVGCSFFVISNALFIIRVAMGSWFLVSISINTHINTTYKTSKSHPLVYESLFPPFTMFPNFKSQIVFFFFINVFRTRSKYKIEHIFAMLPHTHTNTHLNKNSKSKLKRSNSKCILKTVEKKHSTWEEVYVRSL